MKKVFSWMVLVCFMFQVPGVVSAASESKTETLDVAVPNQSPLSLPEPSQSKDLGPSLDKKALYQTNKPVGELVKRSTFNKLSKPTPQIYKLSMRSNVVYKLQTALGFVSTLDLPEPALKVFIGDAELFKASVFEKQVLIKPVTDYMEARTNLTIFTESARLSFDVSVGKPETADFVLAFRKQGKDILVDNAFQRAVEEKRAHYQIEYEKKEKALSEKAENLAKDKLKEEVVKRIETKQLHINKDVNGIRLSLRAISGIGDKLYLRFKIQNLSDTPYKISRAVIGLEGYEKKNLGLGKDPQGLSEIPSELKIDNPVLGKKEAYGVIVFEKRNLKGKERPTFLVFEDTGTRNFKIQDFDWIHSGEL